MKKFKEYTLRQFIVAYGISRELTINEICELAGCTRVYYYKLIKTHRIDELIPMFRILPPDKDTKIHNGLGTALMETARLIYAMGEKTDAKQR